MTTKPVPELLLAIGGIAAPTPCCENRVLASNKPRSKPLLLEQIAGQVLQSGIDGHRSDYRAGSQLARQL
jgi:hypothetical protein